MSAKRVEERRLWCERVVLLADEHSDGDTDCEAAVEGLLLAAMILANHRGFVDRIPAMFAATSDDLAALESGEWKPTKTAGSRITS